MRIQLRIPRNDGLGSRRLNMTARKPSLLAVADGNAAAILLASIPETPVVTEASQSRKIVTIASILFLLVLLPAHSQIPTPSQTPMPRNPGMFNVYRTPAPRNDVIASPTPSTRPRRRYNSASPITPTPLPRRENTTSLTTPTQPPRRYDTAESRSNRTAGRLYDRKAGS